MDPYQYCTVGQQGFIQSFFFVLKGKLRGWEREGGGSRLVDKGYGLVL